MDRRGVENSIKYFFCQEIFGNLYIGLVCNVSSCRRTVGVGDDLLFTLGNVKVYYFKGLHVRGLRLVYYATLVPCWERFLACN